METAIEYLQALEEELKYLPAKETRRVIQIYQEKINNALDYGDKIEKILKELPSPQDVAKGIYDSKKVNYLSKRQKEYRNKELLNGLTSLLLSAAVILIFVGILGYLGITSFNMLSIIPKFSSQDKIIMSIFVGAYFSAMILVMVYLFDLGFLITTFLLSKFLRLFPKLNIDYEQLQSFSISGCFEKWTKKKYFLGKVLLALVIVMVVFGVTSLVGKGYLYRSFMDSPNVDNVETFEVEDEITEIVLETTSANIIIQKGQKFQIINNSEFNRNFNLKTENQQLIIEFDEKQNYDFLGMLNEPTILITIELPETLSKSVNIKLNSGKLAISEVHLDKGYFNILSGDMAIKNAEIKYFNFETDDAQLDSNSCEYDEALINIVHGKFASSNDIYLNAEVKNGSGDIAVQNNTYNQLKLSNTSGTIVVQKSTIETFDYESVASILTMSEIESQYFNITSKNASQFTLTDLEAKLYTFDLSTGYVNMSKVVGDLNIVKSLSNMTISELVGDLNGNIENSTFAVYNSIFNNLKVNLTNCNLDLDNVDIDNINVVTNKVQAIWIDVYGDNFALDLTNSNLEYYNNDSTKVIDKIYIKSIGSQYDIDETVNYNELQVE